MRRPLPVLEDGAAGLVGSQTDPAGSMRIRGTRTSNGQVASAWEAGGEAAPGVACRVHCWATRLDGNGDVQFGVQNRLPRLPTGRRRRACNELRAPSTVAVNGPQIPLVSLAATVGAGGRCWGADAVLRHRRVDGDRGMRADFRFWSGPRCGGDGSSVTLSGLSFVRERRDFGCIGVWPAQLYPDRLGRRCGRGSSRMRGWSSS